MIGFCYDLFGRRLVLSLAYILLIITMFAFPSIIHDLNWVLVARIVVAIALAAIIQNPLVCDFIKKDSRGKGAGIELAGG